MSAATPTEERSPEGVTRHGPLFWITAAIGGAGIGFGLHGLFHDPIDTRPANWAKFFVGGVVIHDAIFAPFVLAAGYGIAKLVPGRVRAYVQGALLIVGCLALFAYPAVRDYAAPQHNPTSLPYNYTANLLAVAFAVVVAVAVTAVGQHLLRRRGRHRTQPPSS